MAWNTNISSSSTSGSDDSGSATEPTDLFLLSLASTLQHEFDAAHLVWNNIPWATFPVTLTGVDISYLTAGNNISVIRGTNGSDHLRTLSNEALEILSLTAATATTVLSDAESDVDSAESDIADAEQDLTDAESDVDSAEFDIADAEQDLADAEQDLADAKQDLANAKQDLANAEPIRDQAQIDSNEATAELEAAQEPAGAFLGFAGDDIFLTNNLKSPQLLGGSGDDDYILETDLIALGSVGESTEVFSMIIEHGNDDGDSIISYNNDWAWALDINGQHLVLSDADQNNTVVIWDYNVPEARIENYWFDFDNNGINEHYSLEEFITTLKDKGFWAGSFQAEELGISSITLNDLSQSISEATLLSTQIENSRQADLGTVKSIARLYETAFDRTPDESGLNHWIDTWETKNVSLGQIADRFYASEEFKLTYGALDDNAYITQLYANVLDRTPDQPGFDHWANTLSNGVERADVMVRFSESLENKINTELQLSGLAEVTPGEWAL